MSKRVKGMLIETIRERIGESRDLLLIDSSKLDANTANRFRLALREKGMTALTVQNTLARRALNGVGISSLDSLLEGPSTLVWGGQDIVDLSKEIAKWAKEIKELEVKGGTSEGETLDAAGVEALSKSLSREELLSRLAGMLLSPGAKLAAALLGPGAMLASQIEKISDGEGGSGETDAAESEPAGEEGE
jgi:large subunit ribosomal protein L10